MSKTGRNDPCPCGSGLKYKACCGTNGKPMIAANELNKQKKMTPQGLNRLFVKLVDDLGGFDISCEDLGKLSKDVALRVKYDDEKDSFRFEVVKIKLGKVLQPNKRIIVPN